MVDHKIEELLDRYRSLEDQLAQATADRVHAEDYKKSLLALLMKDAETLGAKTAAAQEREALCNPKYIEWLEHVKTAVARHEKLRFHRSRLELEVEVWRTVQANERMERKAYGA